MPIIMTLRAPKIERWLQVIAMRRCVKGLDTEATHLHVCVWGTMLFGLSFEFGCMPFHVLLLRMVNVLMAKIKSSISFETLLPLLSSQFLYFPRTCANKKIFDKIPFKLWGANYNYKKGHWLLALVEKPPLRNLKV